MNISSSKTPTKRLIFTIIMIAIIDGSHPVKLKS